MPEALKDLTGLTEEFARGVGVTMIRRIPSKQRNESIRERDQGALIRLGLLLVGGLALAGGFLYGGGQHFAALKYGYETEDLRRVRDQLAEQQRRFLLAREEAASPSRLERAARQLGMQPMQPLQIDPLKRFAKSAAEKAAPALSQAASSARDAQANRNAR